MTSYTTVPARAFKGLGKCSESDFLLTYLIVCGWVFCLLYVCEPHPCSAKGGQKKATEPLEVEFQTVVSCPVGAGNQTQVPEEQPVSAEPSPPPDLFFHCILAEVSSAWAALRWSQFSPQPPSSMDPRQTFLRASSRSPHVWGLKGHRRECLRTTIGCPFKTAEARGSVICERRHWEGT